MQNVMGVINLGNQQDILNELTYFRDLAAVPFAGKYRLIDFALSNMVNSRIKDIAVLPTNKYRSLIEHLGTGRDWDLDRKQGGLFILPPTYPKAVKYGDLHNFYQHLDFFITGQQKYVLISGGNLIANIDYRPALDFHQQVGADVTVLYKDYQEAKLKYPPLKRIETDQYGRVISIEDQYLPIFSSKLFMEVLILDKQVLLQMVESCLNEGGCNLISDGLSKNLHNLRVYGFPFLGYLGSVNSVTSYYNQSMKLLQSENWKELFYQPRLIYTKSKNEPPSRYSRSCRVKNSLAANGCVIDGTVENSILFRGVKVAKGAIIKNSIIMQKSEIGENVVVENSILDKKVMVTAGKTIQGENDRPLVIAKRIVI